MEEEANKLNIKELHNVGAEKVLRLLKVMKFYDLNKSEMAERLGMHQSNLSKIILGRRPIGKAIDAKFLLACPEINKTWYLSGEGEMLREGLTTFGPVAIPAPANENPDEEESELIAALKKQISLLTEIVAEKDRQIDRLLKLLEK
jgi:transcriptional regulator with XRE-family HTH domain